ncbi:sugar phosphate isomerase/epimerase family protein [Blastococcus sp. SYSU DS0533]
MELYLCASTMLDAELGARLDAAAAAGYEGVGLRPVHLERALAEGWSVADVRSRLADGGLEVVEVGFLADWWPGGDEAASRESEREILALADALGGRHLLAVGGPLEAPLAEVAARFAAVCDRAAGHGLAVALEFLPWRDVSGLREAWQVVESAGRPNAGIMLDTWHFFRGTSVLADLDDVPPERIVAVQLSDGPLEVVVEEQHDTKHLRRVPGEGQFDLPALFDRLTALGVEVPVGVEVISTEMRALDPLTAAARAADATRALLG